MAPKYTKSSRKAHKAFEHWRPHPWHGLTAGSDPPRVVLAYIEITPFDSVKYEIDKETGYLRAVRPQRTSSLPPALYGFIPKTFCGSKVAALLPGAERGDEDPLDICVFSERPINRAEVLLNSRVIGGISLVDDGAADDKIIAVLENDSIWGQAKKLADIPAPLIDRLQHYFATYKLAPERSSKIIIHSVYDFDHAARVVSAAMEDYEDNYG